MKRPLVWFMAVLVLGECSIIFSNAWMAAAVVLAALGACLSGIMTHRAAAGVMVFFLLAGRGRICPRQCLSEPAADGPAGAKRFGSHTAGRCGKTDRLGIRSLLSVKGLRGVWNGTGRSRPGRRTACHRRYRIIVGEGDALEGSEKSGQF